MCGIAGVLNETEPRGVPEAGLRQMILALRHRGPDEFGLYRDAWVGLASARLSIVDLAGGQQPIGNEDGSLWIVFNGEIFNYPELRARLEGAGHTFATECDTEVVLHLYEEDGPDCLRSLNGQFAIALWDAQARSLLLARDRLGIRPLFYTRQDGRLVFGSEVKAILTQPGIEAHIDPEALEQVFTYWSPQSPRSIFRGIQEVPPGHYLLARQGDISVRSYWQPDFGQDEPGRTDDEYFEAFEELLTDATRIRLRADVPVGAYLSGGIDSSVVAALVATRSDTPLDTFSIAFSDAGFDESPHQRRMALALGTHHQEVFCTHGDIAQVFPDVTWHTETPILRTAPAPMYLLSRRVHEHGYKVVLTGEGADEILAGYDIFKEMRVRRFWARQPDSQLRPMLFARLYQDIPRLGSNDDFRRAFFGQGLTQTDAPDYSHRIRWQNTTRIHRFLAHDPVNGHGAGWQGRLPEAFSGWTALGQAQYLEMVSFLSPYLLSSQGDRMSMAHSVEGRYPFLDYRLVEFCGRLPDDLKLRGLTEKWLLRKLARTLVPPEIWKRTKRPYRAPIRRTFFGGDGRPDYVDELLSTRAVADTGYFKPAAVERLVRKAKSEAELSEIEEMAVVGILSTQLVDRLFVRGHRTPPVDDLTPSLKIVDATTLAAA
ncbi:MAG TPA: asparagine synthase (glutamine-hydrolyzing) [Anaerolineales bacterium]|nr:asparagine synthase (glutamine-hydrolyzing) [Anaerolineales bacterium]